MELSELMRGFALRIGIADVPPCVDGTYQLDIDGMPIMLFARDGELTTLATLGRLPEEGAEALGWRMMEAMYLGKGSGGATFSVDYEEGSFCLQRRDRLEEIDADGFCSRFDGFVTTAETWRRIVDGAQVVPPVPG